MTSSVLGPPGVDDQVSVFGRRIAYKWVVATVLVSALFLDILDTTIVNVALPTLGREFGPAELARVPRHS